MTVNFSILQSMDQEFFLGGARRHSYFQVLLKKHMTLVGKLVILPFHLDRVKWKPSGMNILFLIVLRMVMIHGVKNTKIKRSLEEVDSNLQGWQGGSKFWVKALTTALVQIREIEAWRHD